MKRGGPLQRKVPLRANGGKARAEKLSAERRSEIARAGGLALQAQRVASRKASAFHGEQRAVMVSAANMAEPVLKTPNRVDHAIRQSARDEQCLIRLPGCIGGAIWSHNRHGRAGKGGAIKALDLNGCYACSSCDAVYDGQASLPAGYTRERVELAWYHAHAESLVRLRQKGLA